MMCCLLKISKCSSEFCRRPYKRNQTTSTFYSGYSDLPPDFLQMLQKCKDAINAIAERYPGEFILNQMTTEELKKLSSIVKILKKFIQEINKFHANKMYEHVSDVGDNAISFVRELANAGNTGVVSNFILWQQLRPAYAFERFGEGDKSKSTHALKDLARTHIEMHSWDDIPAVLNMLDEMKIPYTAEAKNTPFGYKGLHILIKHGNISCELQLSTPEAWKVKMQTEEIYAKWRDVNDVNKFSLKQRAEMERNIALSRDVGSISTRIARLQQFCCFVR